MCLCAILTSFYFLFVFLSAVSDDMLPSDIEVVVREGYHVSRSVCLLFYQYTQECTFDGLYSVFHCNRTCSPR